MTVVDHVFVSSFPPKDRKIVTLYLFGVNGSQIIIEANLFIMLSCGKALASK